MHVRKMMIILGVFLITATVGAWAGGIRVISYGADLTDQQREQVYAIFGLKEDEKNDIAVTEVSNEEEREYLQDLVAPEVIGSKAISCAYVELLGAGQGIKVKTHNITWVTPEMYASALATAQVKDARIIAAAPFPVSGTAALTGIFKAFEAATGKSLSKEAKDLAQEEMVRTGEIGKSIDDRGKAADLVLRIKEEVIKRDLSDPEEIRQVVINISHDLKVKLTEDQIDRLVSLMKRINGLHLSMAELNTQLQEVRSRLDIGGIRGLLSRIAAFLARIVDIIKSLFG